MNNPIKNHSLYKTNFIAENFHNFDISLIKSSWDHKFLNDRSAYSIYRCGYVKTTLPAGTVWEINCKQPNVGRNLIITDRRRFSTRIVICEIMIYKSSHTRLPSGGLNIFKKFIVKYNYLKESPIYKFSKPLFNLLERNIYPYSSIIFDSGGIFELRYMKLYVSKAKNSYVSFKIYFSRKYNTFLNDDMCDSHDLNMDGEILSGSIVRYTCSTYKKRRYIIFDLNGILHIKDIYFYGSKCK